MQNSFTKRITFGSVIQFTLPTIIMMIFMSSYMIVDGVIISRLINTDALSAANIVYPLLSVIVAMGTMFGTGSTAIVARKLGEKKEREARENFTFIMICALFVGILVAAVILLFLEPLLYLLGANETVYPYCYAYALPLVFFLPASILQLMFQSLFVAAGKPNFGLTVTAMAGLANIVLDYVFIRFFNTGIAGAAVATGIGYCIPALAGILYFSFTKKNTLRFVKPRADWNMLVKSVTNGSSEMVTNMSVSVTTLLFNIIMMHFLGSDGVAAITIVLYVDFLLIAVNLGYSMGVAPLISYNYGKGDHSALQKLYRISIRFSVIFSAVVTTATILCAGPLVAIFTRPDTAVYEFAVQGMVIYAFSYLVKGYNIFSSAMFTAFSNGKVSAALSFVRTLVLLVVCTLGLTVIIGVDGVWYAAPLAELLAFCLCFICMRKYRHVYHYRP